MKTNETSSGKETTTTQASTQVPENTSTTTETPGAETSTQQTKDSTSEGNPVVSKGILEESTSTEDPVDGQTESNPAGISEGVEGKEDANVSTGPEPYELSLSEESPLSDEEFDEIVQEAERLKLGKEDAEKLIQMREYSHKASNEVFERAAQQRVESMMQDFKADASLHTRESKLAMREAMKAFGTDPSFQEMFKDPSMNFNVPLAKFLISVGNKIREGSDNMPAGKSAAITTESADPLKRAANNFYKNM